MIITCPKCESRYAVEPTQMGNTKRKVRCAHCKHVWEIDCYDQDIQFDKPKRRYTPVPPVIPQQTRLWKRGLFVIVLLCIILSAILGRHMIMNQWPKTAYLYEKLGFQVAPTGEGLQILETEAFLTNQDNDAKKKLLITGKIVNTSNETKLIPPLRISIEGPCHHNKKKVCVLQTWQHHLAHSRLLPKETVDFETEEKLTAVHPNKIIVGF